MTSPLTLYYHPLSSFCWKVLIALYENETPFTPHSVNLLDSGESAAFKALWPIGKCPVLRDGDHVVPESSIIIEHLAQHHPGRANLIPSDPALVMEMRLWDRIIDLYVHDSMQKIVGDTLRPADKKDPFGVDHAKTRIETALDMLDEKLADRRWVVGGSFTLADCAAAPALFYVNKLKLIGERHAVTRRYLDRLVERPSFARVIKEAEPYFSMFPGGS